MPGGIPMPGGPHGIPHGLIPGGPPMPIGGGIAFPGCLPSLPLMNAAVVANVVVGSGSGIVVGSEDVDEDWRCAIFSLSY